MTTEKKDSDIIFATIEKEIKSDAWNKISMEFQWTEEFLEKYEDKVDWSLISLNREITWTTSMLEKFKDKVSWYHLSNYSYAEIDKAKKLYTEENLKQFQDYWDWNELSGSITDIELIDKFIDRWDWDKIINNLNIEYGLLNAEFLEKYIHYIPVSSIMNSTLWEYLVDDEIDKIEDKLILKIKKSKRKNGKKIKKDSDYIFTTIRETVKKEAWERISKSFQWTEELLEEYEDKVDWKMVSQNDDLRWTATMLEKFKHKIYWSHLSKREYPHNAKKLYTEENLKLFKDYWDWNKVSGCISDVKLIDRFVDCWDWSEIIDNVWLKSNFFNKKFLEKYVDYIPISSLTSSRLWSNVVSDEIEKMNDKLTFKVKKGKNDKLRLIYVLMEAEIRESLSSDYEWTEELLEKYEDEVDWNEISNNINIPWTKKMLEKFKDKIDWEIFTIHSRYNADILHTEEMLTHFQDYWNWNELSFAISDVNLIDKFVDRWNWSGIVNNSNLQEGFFNMEFYKKHINYIPIASLVYSDMWHAMVDEEYKKIEQQILC